MSALAVYVSGHGFGHATRTAEVLRALRNRAPSLRILVCTSAPSELFSDVVVGPLTVRTVECDAGLVQEDALTIDEGRSAEAAARFIDAWPERVARESEWLRDSVASVVLGDIPPLAFAAAAAAGLPSFGLGNFSWDWIYRHLGVREPRLRQAAEHAAAAYARASLLLRLPFAGDLGAFPRIEDVPLVARRPALSKSAARRRLGLDERLVVLLSFGGIGIAELEPAALGALAEYQLLLTASGAGSAGSPVRRLGRGDLVAAGVSYPDLVGAADVVVSKPGYGIVSDCIGAGTRLVYTDRGDFPEYDVFVREMPRYLPVAFVPSEDVRAGRLAEALAQVRAQPFPAPPPMDGAQAVADRVLRAA